MSEDQIRLKNLIHKAVEILKNRDDGQELEQVLCDRLEGLLVDKDFWENRTESLLICVRPGIFEMYDLPTDTEEYVAVDTHFHLAPIFDLLADNREYYVLAIAQHAPALFEGDMYDLYPTKNLTLPETLMAGLNIDEMNQKNEQQRSTGGDTGGYNGRGGAKNPAEEERQRFWRMIDQLVLSKVDTKLPLILAGVESEVTEYRAQSHYPHILQGTIHGSFRGVNHPHALHEKAWHMVEQELIRPTHEQAVEAYERNPSRAAGDVAAITDAAAKGRIDTLLIGMRRYTADTVRDDARPSPVITFPGAEESAQALHDIADTVWAAGGRIVNIEQEAMPGGLAAAAVFRY